MNTDRDEPGESVAPGAIESIRSLLNTWAIPNDTRQPRDELASLFADREMWAATLPDIRFPRQIAERNRIEMLRRTLRDSLLDHHAGGLDALLSAQRWRLAVDADSDTVRWAVDPASAVGDALAIVADAFVARTWSRLRACPDCQWVFYDTSRNGQRTWCSMTAANGARGCGSIAKTRAYRERQRADSHPARGDDALIR